MADPTAEERAREWRNNHLVDTGYIHRSSIKVTVDELERGVVIALNAHADAKLEEAAALCDEEARESAKGYADSGKDEWLGSGATAKELASAIRSLKSDAS